MPTLRDPFGLADSESEYKLLKSDYADLFLDSRFSDVAMQPETYLIVGRRGSGKTALARYFAFQGVLQGPICINVDEPYAYDQFFSEIAQRGPDARGPAIVRLRQIWEYVLWRVIFERLKSESSDIAKACDGPSPASSSPHLMQPIFQWLLSIFHKSNDISTDDHLLQLLFDERFAQARAAALSIAATRPIIIAVDTLEKYDIADDHVMSTTAALIECAAALNRSYSDRGLHVKLFVAGESYTSLVENVLLNPSKSIRHPLYLLWRPRDLLRLISWRLYHYLEAHSVLPAESKGPIDWNDPEDVTAKVWRPCFGWEITNAQGQQERTFPYVLRHTQMRPRQLIHLCNVIANRAIRRGVFPKHSERDILAGVSEGQIDLANEVFNSFSTIYPQVTKIVEALSGVPAVVPGTELDKRAKYSRAAWPTGAYSLQRFRQLLAELGIVGKIRHRNDRDGYADVVFEYSLTSRLVISSNDMCAIHPMFYSSLNVTLDAPYRVMPFGRAIEAEEAEGGPRLYKRDTKSFLRLSRRAESVDRSKLVETFVSVGSLTTLLSTSDHQIIYGRRGTGKTHALLYLDSTVRSKGDVTAYIDLRMIGSTSSLYSNPAVPLPERATRLLMDVLGALHSALHEQIIATQDAHLEKLGPAMDRLADAIT